MEGSGPWIAGHRICRPLADGPRGESFLAARPGAGRRRRWVLKKLELSGTVSLRDSLREDFVDLACLDHPSLLLPASVGIDRRGAHLTRPYVEGADITSALRGCAPEEVFPWLSAAAEALAVLHRSGFAHRNVKGSNLLVPREFLLRRRRHEPRVVLCDPAWWPERARPTGGDGAEDLGLRRARLDAIPSDLWGLGAAFFLILTGVGPSIAGGGPPHPPSELNPRVPTDLDRLIVKLLQTERGRGYEETAALIDDLRRTQSPRRAPRSAGRSTRPSVAAACECFVGRPRELDRACSLWREPNRPSALAIAGESGCGKTTYLRRLELEAQVRGIRTASARCFPEAGGSFAPIENLIDQLIGSSDRSGWIQRRRDKLLREAPEPDGACVPPADREDLRLLGLLELLRQVSSPGPALLLLDDVHLADPRSIRILGKLVEEISSGGEGGLTGAPALPSLAVTYSSEASFRAAMGPLLERWKFPAPGLLVQELLPLAPESVELWLDAALGHAGGLKEKVKGMTAGSGHAYTIREAIRTVSGAPETIRGPRKNLAAFHESYFGSLDERWRRLLRILAVLSRPAPVEFLTALSNRPAAELRPVLASLVGDGTLSEKEGAFYVRHEAFRAWLAGGMTHEEGRACHREIAAALKKSGRGTDEEIAQHWLHSDAPRRGTRSALAAARRLVRSGESRRAVPLYEALLAFVPADHSPRRRSIAVGLAEAHALSGAPRLAIKVLEPLLSTSGSKLEEGLLHGRMGVFLHRSGDVALAIPHLEKALALLDRARGDAPRLQKLRSASELAEILCNRGDYVRAEEICLDALGEVRAAAARGDPAVRREEMILVETLAHLKLRRLEHREARELFERSLRVSEEIEADPETGLILNNLGILHMQENRFADAIGCLLRAGKLSKPLGEPGVLVNIETNLALLFARTGRPDEADEALSRAAQSEARCGSDRIRFLRLHGAGVVNLALGRFPAAIEALKEAISLGERLGDLSMVAFDSVHLGECHLFQGETVSARAGLARALGLGASAPAPVRAMAEARLAALAALGGDERRARAWLDASPRSADGTIEYVGAWNQVFRGWAWRLVGRMGEAEEALGAARRFFSKVKVPGGEVLAGLELAAVEIDRGSLDRARERLAALSDRCPRGQGVLKNPMLAARLLAYRARLMVEEGPLDAGAAESLLADCESFLIGRKLRDIEKLVRSLKKRLARLRGDPRGKIAGPVAAAEHREEGDSSAKENVRASWILGEAPSVRKVRS